MAKSRRKKRDNGRPKPLPPSSDGITSGGTTGADIIILLIVLGFTGFITLYFIIP